MIKTTLKWTCGFIVLSLVVLFYWNLTLEVDSAKVSEEIAAEQKVLDTTKKDRAFKRSQVDRIVTAIENIPVPNVTNIYQVIYIYPTYELDTQ